MTETKPLPQIQQPEAPTPNEPVPNKGFTVLLEGDIGVGKTTALKSLIDKGLTPFIVSTEPGIQSIMGDLPKGSYHYKYIPPGVSSWEDMRNAARLINSSTLKSIAEMGFIEKSKFQQYLDMIDTCANFVADDNGVSYGAVDDWNTDRVFCLDTLSGFNTMCMQFIIGAKPVASMLDWQAAQNINMGFLRPLLNACRCHVVITAHIEREPEELTGGSKIMTASLGKKLAPLLPREFDNVILAEMDKEGKPSWTTRSPNARLKARHLPLGEGLPATFGPLVDNWLAKGGVILPTETA